MMRTLAISVLASLLVVGACGLDGGAGDGRLTIVAAFYPLAWAAERIAPRADVEDLTPPGGEPHDLQLTARQRADVQNAEVVLLFGKGFQPDLERAAKDARGRVVDLLSGLRLLPSNEEGLRADPHVWLDPDLMRQIVLKIAAALADADPGGGDHGRNGSALAEEIQRLDTAYRSGLAGCDLKTLITTHEASGYLAKRYGLAERGLTGLTPEAEPSAAQIQHVRELARRGEVGAVFYEDSDEGRRVGRSVASDAGVPALPLHTLESDPAPLDYIGAMERNLENLRKGLRCR